MPTRFPHPEDMSHLAKSLAAAIDDLHRLDADLRSAAPAASALVLAAHDYVRVATWPAQWMVKPAADAAASRTYRAALDASVAVGEARRALMVLAEQVRATAELVAEAEAQSAARETDAAKLRG